MAVSGTEPDHAPTDNLKRALELLGALDGIVVNACSDVFLTEPQGVKDQPWFANCVARLDVDPDLMLKRGGQGASLEDAAHGLLRLLLGVESDMGRRRPDAGQLASLSEEQRLALKFGPRIIDLDLLLFDSVQCATPELTLPHPRMAQRAFVLVPLCQLAPELIIVGASGSLSVEECLRRLEYRMEGHKIRQ